MGLIADLECPHVIPAGINVRRLTSIGERVCDPQPRRTPGARLSNPGRVEPVTAAGHRPAFRTVTGIVRDTPLVPRAAAEDVWAEASEFLGEALPVEWIFLLAEMAETISFVVIRVIRV